MEFSRLFFNFCVFCDTNFSSLFTIFFVFVVVVVPSIPHGVVVAIQTLDAQRNEIRANTIKNVHECFPLLKTVR